MKPSTVSALSLLALSIVPLPAALAQSDTGPRFVDVTADSGIRFVHNHGGFGQKWLPETMGSGVVAFDANNDGRQDILFINGRAFPGKPGEASTQQLWLNRGGLKFEDATAKSGLGIGAYCMAGAAGDLDNDGDADVYLSCLGQDFLLRNDGGKFEDVSAQAGLTRENEYGASAVLFDADKDGLLDIYVTRYVKWSAETDFFCSIDGKVKSYCTPQSYPGQSARFYRNISREKGKLTFEDRTQAAGLQRPDAKSLGVAMLDVDNDGWTDLAVANDTTPNFLFRNLGDGTFEEIGVGAGMALSERGGSRGGMGIDAADYNRSGRHSLAIGYFSNEMKGLYRNQGNQLLIDVAGTSQVGRNTLLMVAWAMIFFDYDLDGWLDLFEANGHLDAEWEKTQTRVTYAQPQQLFRNEGEGRFVEVTATAGGDLAKPVVARGAAFADFDHDGDPDLVVTVNGGPAKLFENRGAGHGNWLRIDPVGTRGNRDGLGTRIEVKAGGAVQSWYVHTGGSYLSQSEIEPTFGLGKATVADEVVVRWPSGAVSTLASVKANQRIEVKEPQ